MGTNNLAEEPNRSVPPKGRVNADARHSSAARRGVDHSTLLVFRTRSG